MKTITLLFAMLALPVYSADTPSENPCENQPGRFQLVPATVIQDKKPVPVLFRIDTATGRVWSYSCSTLPIRAGTNFVDVGFAGWAPISEDNLMNQAHQTTADVQRAITNAPNSRPAAGPKKP
jgi:hypothetical protein